MNDWNGLSTVVDIFRARSARHPDRPLYICAEPPFTTMTWAEVASAASAVAAELRRQGVGKGQTALLVYPPDSPYFPTALWGCLLAGVVAVPVVPPNPLTLAADVATLSRITENCQARVALTDERYRRIVKLGGVSRFVHRVTGKSEARWPEIVWIATDRLRSTAGHENSTVRLEPDDLAYLQYTSGSTGHPKGVEVRHAELTANLRLMGLDAALTHNEVLLWWVPWWHDMGLVAGFLNAVYHGFRGIFYSPLSFLKNPSSWLEYIHRWKATGISAPGFGYELATRRISEGQGTHWDLSSVRLALLGGEVARPETLEAFAQRFARNGFRRDSFHNVYGIAEATLYVCGIGPSPSPTVAFDKEGLAAGRARPPSRGVPDASVELVSLGCPSTESALVAVREGVACEPGQVGELWLSSPSVSRAYYGNPEASQATFGAALVSGPPHLITRRFLRTGDLGFQWEGQYFICGRSKDLIIVGGRNIYPSDIENSVRDCDPRIRPGGVAAFGQSSSGPESERVVVLVEARDTRLDRAQCDAILVAVQRTVLTVHRVRCSSVVLLAPGAILKTSSGKVRRRANREALEAGKLPVLHTRYDTQSLEATPPPPAPVEHDSPRNEYEAWIIQWLARTLNLPQQSLDPQEQFLELGADSLAMVQLSAELGQAFGLTLAPEAPWDHPSPRALAEHVASVASGQSASDGWSLRRDLWQSTREVEPPSRGTILTPRERTWLSRIHASGNHPAFALPASWRLPAPLEPKRLMEAYRRVLAAEPLLRTCYKADEPPEYQVESVVPADVRVHDLSALSPTEGRAQARALLLKLSREAIPVEQAPLVRLDAFKLAESQGEVLVRAHHLIADGIGLNLLVQRLDQAYREFQAPDAHEQSDEGASARSLAVWQDRYFVTDEGVQRRAEATARLARLADTGWSPSVVRLAARAGAPMQRRACLSGAERYSRWSSLARQEAVSLATLMAAAYTAFLRSGFQLPAVGLQAATNLRSIPFFRELLGDLANDYGLVCEAPTDATFRELLKHLEGEDRAARPYLDIPWAWLGHTEAAFTFQLQTMLPTEYDAVLSTAAVPLTETLRLTSWRDGLVMMMRVLPLREDVGLELTALSDICPEEGVAAMLDGYLSLLDRLVEDPDQSVSTAADEAAAGLRRALLGLSGQR